MEQQSTLLVLVAAGWIVPALLLLVVWRTVRRDQGRDEQGFLLLQGQLDALREQVRAGMDANRRELDARLERTTRAVGDVHRGLGEVDRQVRSVEQVARDLRGLQELLRSPKLRGGLGEYLLAELLAQVLPVEHFTLQHRFSDGEIVDAVLRIGDALVPVDSKFPLENFERLRAADPDDDEPRVRRVFRRDVQRHVDAIATKYVRPDEGTYDFGMMYLPSEGLYRELLDNGDGDGPDLLQYALSRRVVPVSPQTFYAYLQVIVLGLRGLRVDARSREIVERLARARRRLDRFGESFEVATKHVGNAQRQLDESARRLARLEAVIDELAG